MNDNDLALLHIEQRRWNHEGAKATAVRDQLGMTMHAYYQRLGWLIDQPETLQEAPSLVWRLRRLRDSRRKGRLGDATGTTDYAEVRPTALDKPPP